MRINCEVTLVSRFLPGASMRQPRPVRSTLALAKQGQETVLHLCTIANKQGSKYKILKNLESVFSKFAKEGKFTIRLKEPKLDLVVKTDPVQALGFLNTLKACVTGKGVDKVQLSHMAPAKTSQLAKPKTTLVVQTKKEYPITVAFPYSLQHLTVNSCALNHIESRMLRLKKLQTLNLSNNQIPELPRALTAMPCLTELTLTDNSLDRLHHDIFDGPIARTLAKLDLSRNSLEYLPCSVLQLQQLATLTLATNRLRRLPFSVARMAALRYLDVSDNALDSLPFSLLLRTPLLVSLHVGYNPFQYRPPPHNTLPAVLPLAELAARRVADSRSLRAGVQELPRTLASSITHHCCCSGCRAPIVRHSILAPLPSTNVRGLDLAQECSMSVDHRRVVLLQVFCSQGCLSSSRRRVKYAA